MSFIERVKGKMSKFGRLDLAIADVRKLDTRSVKMVLSFVENLGAPTKSEVTQFFELHLPELTPNMESAYNTKGGIFVLASVKEVTRPIEDTQKLNVVVAGLKFLDSDMGTAWEVEEKEGKQVLQQVAKLDVAELVRERAKRMNRVAAKLEINANVASLGVGDTVKYWHLNRSHEGVVQNISLPKVTLSSNGEKIILDVHAVYKVLKNSPGKEKEGDENLKEYYSQVFGPSYAKDLVKK